MMGKNKDIYTVTDEDLRNQGYLTVDEFMDKFGEGLREYLKNTLVVKDRLVHPEDLIANTLAFSEVAWQIITRF
jgi:hypothetical protein